MNTKKPKFLMCKDWEIVFDILDDQSKLCLLKAIFEFQNTGNVRVALTEASRKAFENMKMQFISDNKEYNEKCKQNRANINKRYKKDTAVFDRIRPNTHYITSHQEQG